MFRPTRGSSSSLWWPLCGSKHVAHVTIFNIILNDIQQVVFDGVKSYSITCCYADDEMDGQSNAGLSFWYILYRSVLICLFQQHNEIATKSHLIVRLFVYTSVLAAVGLNTSRTHMKHSCSLTRRKLCYYTTFRRSYKYGNTSQQPFT
jgi:hypothetical protein